MSPAPRLVDVSVPLQAGLATYPGNPEFELQPVKRIATGGSANVSRLIMGTHTGTHVDAPRHFFDNAAAIDALPLDLLIGRARVVDVPFRGGITEAHLADADLREDIRVLLRTPNSALWRSMNGFHEDYTYLTEAGARYLVNQGVKVVGIDYLSVEQFKRPGAPAHHALLGDNVVIIEGLNLSDAEPGQYEMYCLPLRVTGADGAPARVVLKR
jgi:arylformamidase